ncbi:MAG: hypothetical protein KGL63_01265 [Betaproteobacteria bacterium]|nr:hypothetical protein [Betaproteobacteria bacterium]
MSARGLRQAAVALAAMHSADRRWILGQLPPSQARALMDLLHDVESMGPVPTEWLRDALASPLVADFVPPTPSILIHVLDGLSPTWAARMLKAAAPDHFEIYLAACETRRAQAVKTAIESQQEPLPQALAQALLHELRHLIRTLPDSEADGASLRSCT